MDNDNLRTVDPNNQPMTVWQWMYTLILLAIPIVNVICSILWLFGVGNKSRCAFIRAFVVFAVIFAVLIIIMLNFLSAQILDFLNKIINS